jgi:hypothetical protein
MEIIIVLGVIATFGAFTGWVFHNQVNGVIGGFGEIKADAEEMTKILESVTKELKEVKEKHEVT